MYKLVKWTTIFGYKNETSEIRKIPNKGVTNLRDRKLKNN